ncbi:hypothetical protein AMR41_14585 [Hapalosiphon sp. MRB220]|nr:hypothetical protein AMR41_14585 [Hapalosiphon sp. MRB220]
MKNFKRIREVFFATNICFLSITSVAVAGEGGFAGAAAYSLENGIVTGVAQGAAIGKNDAAAAAFNNGNTGLNSAYALGSAGAITMTNLGSPTSVNILGSIDPNFNTEQTNQLTNSASIQLGTIAGNNLVTLP